MIPKADMSGWFVEREDEHLWPGQRFALKVKEPLHAERSEFQDILVFQSANHGRVLALDGVVQLTEWDEFSYQEMITHLPLFAHAAPESVLIIGAGDGGVLREVCRHRSVRRVAMVEIDRQVVEASKTFFAKTMATDFEDPRLTLRFEDAAKFVADCEASAFDVVIVDSSDPNDGPASVLFTADFYSNLARVLKPGGIVCTQGECQWLNLSLIKSVLKKAKDFFPNVDYAYTCTPTYPCGQIGFLLCYKSSDPEYVRSQRRPVPADMAKRLRYYSPAMHKAAFALPRFAEDDLATLRPRTRTSHSPLEYATYAAILVGAGLAGAALATWLGGAKSAAPVLRR